MNPIFCDVAVVGLGPAGASAAAVTAAEGCRVIAIDRRRRPGEPVQCAELVPGLIGQDVANIRPHIAQSVTRMMSVIEQDSGHETAPFPGHIIDRERFDAALVERAKSHDTDCRFGVAVRAKNDNELLLSDGHVIHARVIIGADGPRSVVAHAMGRPNRDFIVAQQISVPLTGAYDATDIYLSQAIPGGYAWMFPRGDIAHIGAGVTVSARASLKATLRRLHDRLSADGRVGRSVLKRTGGLIPAGGPHCPWTLSDSTMTLLAGDAAGLTNPVTGAGIHAALVSGKLAGEAALAALDGCNSGPDYAAELDELFGGGLRRAVRRRKALEQTRSTGTVDCAALRRAWIGFPEYWRSESCANSV